MANLRDASLTYSLCASCFSTMSISATSLSRPGHAPIFRQTRQRRGLASSPECVEDPCRRHVHQVALKGLDANEGHQPYDQPCGSLAGPGADAVDRMQKALRVHARCRPVNGCPHTVQVSTKLASSGIAVPADASITRATVRSSFSHSRECFYLISR
jgi:hypothetical protein